MIGKLDAYLGFHETALSLRSSRQQVLASNIANADTPNYKARDLDFAAALKGALGQVAPGPALAATAKRHFPAAAQGAAAAAGALQYRTPAQGAVDGNTVDMDVERNQFADNAIRYEASITLINAQIKEMMTAIQGAQ
jgi:flagellar basal-body rod protein FlgB